MKNNFLGRGLVIGHWSLVIFLMVGVAEAFPLSITSNPMGAQVFVDGQAQGLTPLTVEIPPERLQCQVMLSLPGYQTVSMGFAVAPVPFLRFHFDLQAEQGVSAAPEISSTAVFPTPNPIRRGGPNSDIPPGDEALRSWVKSLLMALRLMSP